MRGKAGPGIAVEAFIPVNPPEGKGRPSKDDARVVEDLYATAAGMAVDKLGGGTSVTRVGRVNGAGEVKWRDSRQVRPIE